MKKLLATALSVITILSLITVYFSASTNIAYAEEMDAITERINVKVGYLDDYGIIVTPIVQGAEGFGFEYLEKIEEYTNFEFEYIPLTWAEGLEKLKSGEIDVLAPSAMSEKRKEVYDFVDTVFSYEEINIYALEDSDYNYDDFQQLNGKVFGTIEGSVYEQRFIDYAKEHGFDYTLKYTDYDTVVEDINNGIIDLYIDTSLYLRDGVHSIDKVYSEELYLMVKKGNDSLNQALNTAMLKIEDEDPFYSSILWHKYFNNIPKAPRKLTEDEIDALNSKEVFTVGYNADLHPISYMSNGEPKGYSIDVMNLLADKLGIKVKYVPLHDNSKNSPKDVDFNLCPMNDDGVLYGTLSEPYKMQKLLAVRDGELDKSEVQHIMVPDFATIEINKFLQLYPNATVHKTYSTADCGRIKKEVNIDCTIIPDNSEMFINDKINKRISVLDVSVPLGITVSHQLPIGILTALNTSILSLNPTVVDEMVMDNVMALQKQPTIIDDLIEYQYHILTALLLIITAFIFELWHSQQKAKRLLEVDTLTGVMTQYKFMQEAQHILTNAKPNEYMLILLDIDKFKTINKIYGIDLGDKLLSVVAGSLKRQAEKNAIIGRMQGDCFAILTKNNEIPTVKLDDLFVNDCNSVGIDITIYFSIGVYLIDKTLDNISYMLDNARTAKAYGKTVFGNTINYFTKELHEKHEKENAIIASMETALAEGEFFIVVQPKFELQTERLVGGEVLIRWKKKDGTFVYPDEFIPLFEENKFIVQLDRYVLEKTCEFIRDSKVTLPVLSINLSANTMLEPDFIQYGLDVLDSYGVIPQQIEVELTENVLDFDYKLISKAVSDLKRVGFAIAIDDFGKGASSLARIKEVEMDVLKLDKEFMAENTMSEKGKLVLSNIISMANDLGITSLAEGIETKEQLNMLVKLGCDQGQGYYFDRPLSTVDFMQSVEANNKVSFEPIIRHLKDYKFWNNSKDLPYGVAVAKNDPYATIVQANDAFYDIIGYDKGSFKTKYSNRFVSILVDNLYNLIKRYLDSQQYEFSFDVRIITNTGEIVWVHEIVKYSLEDDLFFVTLIRIANQDSSLDGTVAHVDYLLKNNQKLAKWEKQNIVREESSKAGIVNMCINILRTNTAIIDSSATITTILELLRLHYEARSCAIVYFSPDEKKYEIRYMNIKLDDYPNMAVIQNSSFSAVDKMLTLFENRKYSLLRCNTKDFFDTDGDKKIYESIGVENGYLAPMFDVDNNCNGVLVLINPTLNSRSPMLIQIVSKFLSDYQVKYDIYVEHQSKIAIEPMTGLLNKVATEEKITKLLQSGKQGTLFMVDIDNFKQVNDKLGHAMGDKVIIDNAKILQKIFSKGDIIGRVGGDEFIVFVPDLIKKESVTKIAEQIKQSLEKTYGESHVQVPISASIGVCVSWNSGDTFKHLYQEADKALYHAKALGKNRFYVANK